MCPYPARKVNIDVDGVFFYIIFVRVLKKKLVKKADRSILREVDTIKKVFFFFCSFRAMQSWVDEPCWWYLWWRGSAVTSLGLVLRWKMSCHLMEELPVAAGRSVATGAMCVNLFPCHFFCPPPSPPLLHHPSLLFLFFFSPSSSTFPQT